MRNSRAFLQRRWVWGSRSGFTLIEIMIVVAIIGILLAIAGPGWIRQRNLSQRRTCQEQLSKIDGAKEQWALETNAASGAAVNVNDLCAVDGTLYIKADPAVFLTQGCPADGVYAINTVGQAPTCTIAGHVLMTGTDN